MPVTYKIFQILFKRDVLIQKAVLIAKLSYSIRNRYIYAV